MTSPFETGLTLALIKFVTIVGTALIAVLFLALLGTKRR
jgi:hypothetical protein